MEEKFMPFSRGKLHKNDSQLSRRCFLKYGACAAIACVAPRPGFAAIQHCVPKDHRSLTLYNIHTKEWQKAVYWKNGAYSQKALDHLNHLMRDYRTGDVTPIDPSLFDLLHAIRKNIGTDQPFHVISGYRSPETNAYLRKHTSGVAKNSLHMFGKAIDIRMPSCRLSTLRKTALELRRGGVGYYPSSRFVHVDVGDVRAW